MFDSKLELKLSPMFAAHNYYKTDEFHPFKLEDMVGTPFSFKVDFVSVATNAPLVELKSSPLNSRKERTKADTALSKAMDYDPTKKYNHIKTLAWSNSVYKHGLVSQALPPLSYILVFSEPITVKDAKRYLKQKILFCTVAGFLSLVGAIQMVKAGLPVTYIQELENGIASVEFNLPKIFTKGGI
jgi:hypothetical protein